MKIKHKFKGEFLFSCDSQTMRETVEEAVKKGADLRGADLSNTDLRGADLSNTDLRGANFRGADLSNTDLCNADLCNVRLSDEQLVLKPIAILNLRWEVLITDKYMTIGCQRHTHQELAEFNEDRIKSMHPEALEFWFGGWRIALLNMCEAHRNACELAKARGE